MHQDSGNQHEDQDVLVNVVEQFGGAANPYQGKTGIYNQQDEEVEISEETLFEFAVARI